MKTAYESSLEWIYYIAISKHLQNYSKKDVFKKGIVIVTS